jgi:iron complex outermembrane receptor protein
LKNSKLDVDLGYVANDRSEFVDSDVAGLHMKLKTLITMRSTICLKWVTGINCWNSRNASNTNLGKYLIPDATTNDFGVLGLLIMSGITVYFRQVCVLTIEK